MNELTSLAVSGQATRYYAYDKYGNPLSIGPSPTNPCPSGTSTCLGYDAQARLSSVVEANNGPTIAQTYNAMGLRAGYTVTPYGAGQPSLNEQFTYRGGQLAQTVTISGTTSYTDTYVYSQHGMPLELLRTTNGVLNRYWYERDGLGNVVALTDAGGTVVDQYAYDLWGKPTLVQESVPQQLRYQGYWYDNELGWYWLTTRAYDPTLKRFLQPDPSEMDGLFSYVYVKDDPVDAKDPSGFDAAPIYCDSYCQTLIVLDNVWPSGMSADQFQSYGGSLDAPVQGGYDAGSHQWTGEAPASSPSDTPLPGTLCYGEVQTTLVAIGPPKDRKIGLDTISGVTCVGEIEPSSVTIGLYLERVSAFAFSVQTGIVPWEVVNPIPIDGSLLWASNENLLKSCPIDNISFGQMATCPARGPITPILKAGYVYWVKMTLTVTAPGAIEPVEYADTYSPAFYTGPSDYMDGIFNPN